MGYFTLAICQDKGEAFCRPYAVYCKQMKEGGPHKAFMERNCCDSCSKLQPAGMCKFGDETSVYVS